MSESNSIINLKVCLDCGKCEGDVKFQKYMKYCTKCNSKRCNNIIKMNKPSYFKDKMKERYIPHQNKPMGRPRKIQNIEITL